MVDFTVKPGSPQTIKALLEWLEGVEKDLVEEANKALAHGFMMDGERTRISTIVAKERATNAVQALGQLLRLMLRDASPDGSGVPLTENDREVS